MTLAKKLSSKNDLEWCSITFRTTPGWCPITFRTTLGWCAITKRTTPSSYFRVVRFVISRTTLKLAQGGARNYKTHHPEQALGWCVELQNAPP